MQAFQPCGWTWSYFWSNLISLISIFSFDVLDFGIREIRLHTEYWKLGSIRENIFVSLLWYKGGGLSVDRVCLSPQISSPTLFGPLRSVRRKLRCAVVLEIRPNFLLPNFVHPIFFGVQFFFSQPFFSSEISKKPPTQSMVLKCFLGY